MNPIPHSGGNTLLEPTPQAGPPSAEAPDLPGMSPLPAWLAPLLLVGLAVIGGLIALVGWLMLTPSAPREAPAVQQVKLVEPIVESLPPRLPEKPPLRADEPAEEADDPPPRPRPSKVMSLQRRKPAQDSEPDIRVAPMLVERPPASETSKAMRLDAPLLWSLEPPSRGAIGFVVPVEIAKIEDAALPYNVRRLQYADAAPKALKLAVTPVMHDDLGSVLARMGAGYRFTKLRKEDLFSSNALKRHDVVFLTCADLYAQDFQAALPLRKFVANGGTLYASDLRGDLLQAAFPEFRASSPLVPGVPQNIEASVVDPGLKSYLGRKAIPLSFDAPDWRPAPFDPGKVTVCLKGVYRNNLGQAWPVPLLVKFRFQKGTVIFTSFHHVKNDSEIVRKLLEYLVFCSVNARSEARVKDLMLRSHFSPHGLRPLLLTAARISETTYQHPGGPLQIALGFENLGAKLKLTLCSPSGQTIEHAEKGLYLIELPKAERGKWRVRVTPVELPYTNFPIVLAVGATES